MLDSLFCHPYLDGLMVNLSQNLLGLTFTLTKMVTRGSVSAGILLGNGLGMIFKIVFPMGRVNPKIINPIIQLLAIYMMNNLCWRKWTTKTLRHYKAML